ncbi:hypothetical protein BDZ85DRAFT_254292 [Elsinoe ampelina]|uniref:Uncharacterized protein n=1 Tax=Elsinoe ampelina TaxID=302913 RepID=A0A6A6GPL0_9PEZI|nr:hypothetical protein BDZ85DRAFT_254292 [Elsinoe ampelina]
MVLISGTSKAGCRQSTAYCSRFKNLNEIYPCLMIAMLPVAMCRNPLTVFCNACKSVRDPQISLPYPVIIS